MFTGIVQARGKILEKSSDPEGIRLKIDARGLERNIEPGESLAVDGVCLTVEEAGDGWIACTLSPETVRRTTLGNLSDEHEANLEPAVRAGDLLGGHILQGHVDATGELRSLETSGDSWSYEFECPETVLRHCVEKGSIGVNGVSLTIADVRPDGFTAAVIPYTYRVTNLSALKTGQKVNLEADVLSKYVARHVEQLLHRNSD